VKDPTTTVAHGSDISHSARNSNTNTEWWPQPQKIMAYTDASTCLQCIGDLPLVLFQRRTLFKMLTVFNCTMGKRRQHIIWGHWGQTEQHLSDSRGRHKIKNVTSRSAKTSMHSVRTFSNSRIAEGKAGFLPEELHTSHSKIQLTAY
jgi:hypothetical protein